jgi:hypothetical protein
VARVERFRYTPAQLGEGGGLMNMDQEQRLVAAFFALAGLGLAVIEMGLYFARRHGWAEADVAGQRALSFFLLSDRQIVGGARVAWAPVDWAAVAYSTQ